MRFLLALVFIACGIGQSLSQTPAKQPPVNPQIAHDAANLERNRCLVEWMSKLAASTDSIEHVADAVLLSCRDAINKWKLASRHVYRDVPFGELVKVLEEGQRKAVVGALVSHRVEAKSNGASGLVTGSLPQATEKAKTQEGAIAECDMADAQFRKWAAERGHVRVAIIEERVENDEKCRNDAKKLPSAADYHAKRQ